MEVKTLNNTQQSADRTGNKKSNSEIIKRKDIKDTPFTVITVNKEHFGSMGNYRITEKYKTRDAVERELKKVTWNRVIQVIMLLQEMNKETNKN